MTTETKTAIEFWAIVELFGHNTIAGFVTEQSIGGGAFIRVDVPAVDEEHQAFTKFYGDKAVYAITPTTEEVARHAAMKLRVRPVSPYVVPVPPSDRQLVDSTARGVNDEDWDDGGYEASREDDDEDDDDIKF